MSGYISIHADNKQAVVISAKRFEESPYLVCYDAPEIVWRIDKKHHVGFIIKSPSLERVHELMDDYIPRIERDFQAVLPAPEKPTH